MPKFKDTKGREWSVEIHLGTIRRMKKDGLDFYSLAENKFAKLLELDRDDGIFAEWLYAVIKPEAEAANVSLDDLCAGLMGDALGEARKTWATAYSDFFPDQPTRSAIAEMLNIARQIQAEAAKEVKDATERLAKIGREKMKQIVGSQMSEEAIREMIEKMMGPKPSLLPNSKEISVVSADS